MLIVAVATLVFMLENPTPVSVSFLGWSTPHLPISLFLVISMLTGLVLGPFFTLYTVMRKRNL
ncbi:lipopolysaccharide assembly protein LapA domain-containing protein [Pseudomonas fluorescens]|uniref:lipopolysaccharide assembly protein LapA domain-containing protein n=1 Tax=Pseudomonas fluorescens TaxID=294 RepID=UPI00352589BA